MNASAIPTHTTHPPLRHQNQKTIRQGRPNITGVLSKMSCSRILEERQHSFRAFFADRWATFLRENYRNPEHVSVVFGVRFQTASNWWQGVNAPSGYAVAMAFQTQPQSAARHLSLDI